MGKQVDLLVDLYENNAIYNSFKDDIFLKQSPFQAWKGAWDKNHAFVYIILEFCSPPKLCVLDLIMGTSMKSSLLV
jgi:hypothetical protein